MLLREPTVVKTQQNQVFACYPAPVNAQVTNGNLNVMGKTLEPVTSLDLGVVSDSYLTHNADISQGVSSCIANMCQINPLSPGVK